MSHNLNIPAGFTFGSGEYIELDYTTHPAILIENENFGAMTTIVAKGSGPVQITGTVGAGNAYTGTGIKLVNCSNIRFIGFNVEDTLYGIETIDCSNIHFYNFRGENIGQEVVSFRSTPGNTSGGCKLINSVLLNGGLFLSQYGEMVYVGDGSSQDDGVITDVEIRGNYIQNSGNEAIDIKTNCLKAKIFNNIITDTNLHFNGAITIATENAAAVGDREYYIAGNVFQDIVNINGYSVNAIAVGLGDTYIWNNTFIADEFSTVYGVRAYSTFNNAGSNRIFLGPNDWRSLRSQYHYAETDAGAGTSRSPIVLNRDPSTFQIPNF